MKFERKKLEPSRTAERRNHTRFRGITKRALDLVKKHYSIHKDGDKAGLAEKIEKLKKEIRETARPVFQKEITHMVGRLDSEKNFRKLSRQISKRMKEDLFENSTAVLVNMILTEQLILIDSISDEIKDRAIEYVKEDIAAGRRIDSTVSKLATLEGVSFRRARTIARTETARANSSIIQARSMQAGSKAYIWQTSKDEAVRESHRKLQGKRIQWDKPPKTDGLVGHAGCTPNCRCFPEPIFED